jgi:hypothetical protein
MTAKAIRAAGMSWYRAEDYGRILEIMEDADKLPPTYDQWRRGAERGERELKGRRDVVIRAMIDPDEFPAWCREKGLKLDADGRTTFASWVAYQQVKDTH